MPGGGGRGQENVRLVRRELEAVEEWDSEAQMNGGVTWIGICGWGWCCRVGNGEWGMGNGEWGMGKGGGRWGYFLCRCLDQIAHIALSDCCE